MSGAISLAPRLDTGAATDLFALLSERIGQPVELDGTGVRYVGGHFVQVLVAAHRRWRADSQSFSVTGRSADLDAGLRLLGFDPSKLDQENHS